MGSFETDVALPDMRKMPFKMSSIVLSSARVPSKAHNPLVQGGQQYVPNISHVFREGQHLFLVYEVYGPAKAKAVVDPAGESSNRVAKGAINLLSTLELIQGSVKVFETPVVQSTLLNTPERNAVTIGFDVPLDNVKPGSYIGQVNVVDDAAGNFAFPRFAVLIREPSETVAPRTPSANNPPSR